MKKYADKFSQDCARNLQFGAMAVLGLGIAIFCTASCPPSNYTVPEGCTPSVTVSPADLGGSCFIVDLTATCVGDDPSDTVLAYNNGIIEKSMPYDGDSDDDCDTTSWGVDGNGQYTSFTLLNGLNKFTATSCESGVTSPEVDIRSDGDGTACQVNVTTGCPVPTYEQYRPNNCGAEIDFIFSCLRFGDSFDLHEDITGCVLCSGTEDILWQDNGSGGYKQIDSCLYSCPGHIKGDFDCTCDQTWTLTDTSTGKKVLSGKTSRHVEASKSAQTLKVTVSGDGSGTAQCPVQINN